MSQGPWGPQGQQGGYNPQGGGSPQGGGFPQGGGYPQGGGFGQGGGFPQGPQQGGYQPQGGQQGMYGQGGNVPGGFQGGYQPPGQQGFARGSQPPQPPRQGGNGKIIGLVVGGLVIAALLGTIIAFVVGGGDTPGPTVTPQTPTPPSTSTGPVSSPPVTTRPPTPTPPPAPNPTTPAPAPTTTGPAPAGGVDIGNGIIVTPAAGWEVDEKEPGYVSLTNGTQVLAVATNKVTLGATGAQIVDSYFTSMTAKLTGAKRTPNKEMSVDPKLSASNGQMSGTLNTSQGSVPVGLACVGSVRKSDGVAVRMVLIFTPGGDMTQAEKDFNQMIASTLKSQAG